MLTLYTLQTTPTPENNIEEANEIKKKEVKAKTTVKKTEEKAKGVEAEETKLKEPEAKPKAKEIETKPKETKELEAKPKEVNEVKPQTKSDVKAPEIVEPKEKTVRKPSVAKVPILAKFYIISSNNLTYVLFLSISMIFTTYSFFMQALFIIRYLDMILCVSYLIRKYLRSTCQI